MSDLSGNSKFVHRLMAICPTAEEFVKVMGWPTSKLEKARGYYNGEWEPSAGTLALFSIRMRMTTYQLGALVMRCEWRSEQSHLVQDSSCRPIEA